MKIARVIALFKNGNINDFTNYIPISLFSQFSKKLEKDVSQPDDVTHVGDKHSI